MGRSKQGQLSLEETNRGTTSPRKMVLDHPPLPPRQCYLLACIFDVEEGQDVAVIDIPNVFIQTKIDDEAGMAIIKIRGVRVEMLVEIAPDIYKDFMTTDKKIVKQLIVKCKNAIYETMVA
jgi:hypothetical protein